MIFLTFKPLGHVTIKEDKLFWTFGHKFLYGVVYIIFLKIEKLWNFVYLLKVFIMWISKENTFSSVFQQWWHQWTHFLLVNPQISTYQNITELSNCELYSPITLANLAHSLCCLMLSIIYLQFYFISANLDHLNYGHTIYA